jgi:hypothetical protein
MIKRLLMALAAIVPASAALATVLGMAPAGASIIGDPVYTNTGVAGAYMTPNANRLANGDHVSGVRTTFTLTPAMEYGASTGDQPNVGVELCRFTSLSQPGASAVLYAVYNTTEHAFDVWAEHGSNNAGGGCLGKLGGLTGTATEIDAAVPVGDQLFLAITVSSHHVITYTDSDETLGLGGHTTFGGFTFGFDRAGVGTNADDSILTTPATNPFGSFTPTSVRDTAKGWATINQHNLTRMNTVKVIDTTDGTSAGGQLLVPSIVGASTLDLAMGQLSNS